ncbi:MAG: TRAP transporter substrate-binding protein [Oscillospiraceae bacterium]|nr:TRAP transporter substrate-binding protein [Oscillospiraceae bacterium]
MKKAISILCLVALVLSICAGCGGSTTTTTPPASTSSDATTTAPAADAGTDDTVYTFKWAHVSPEKGDKQGDAILETIDALTEKSNGRIEIQYYPASELGSEDEIFEGIQMGTIDIGTLSCGSMSNFVPDLAATTIPFLFRDRHEAWDFFDSDCASYLSDCVYNKTGVRVLGWAENGLRCFSSTKKQIKSPADLTGMRIRTQQNPVTMEMVTAMGGNPQAIAFSELYTALQQGTVDAQENPPSLIFTQGLYEVTPYLTLDYHVYDFLGVFMNETALNKLPDDLKTVFNECIADFVVRERQLSEEYDTRDIKNMEDNGVTVYTPTADEHQAFVDSTVNVVDTVRGIAGDEAVDKVMAQLETLRG